MFTASLLAHVPEAVTAHRLTLTPTCGHALFGHTQSVGVGKYGTQSGLLSVSEKATVWPGHITS